MKFIFKIIFGVVAELIAKSIFYNGGIGMLSVIIITSCVIGFVMAEYSAITDIITIIKNRNDDRVEEAL